MSATSGPRTRMCTTSPIAKTIATPARRLAAASSEWMTVAGNTASRATAKSALAAAKACARRIRATTRTAGLARARRVLGDGNHDATRKLIDRIAVEEAVDSEVRLHSAHALYAFTVVPRAPNFCAFRRVSSNFERA